MSGADFWRVGYGAAFAKDIHRIEQHLQSVANALEDIRDQRGVQPSEAERRFEGDVVAQIVWQTLIDRGNDREVAQRAMDEAYSYEPFGQIVDDIEDVLEALPDQPVEKPEVDDYTGFDRGSS